MNRVGVAAAVVGSFGLLVTIGVIVAAALRGRLILAAFLAALLSAYLWVNRDVIRDWKDWLQ